jgi:hypothetical protein
MHEGFTSKELEELCTVLHYKYSAFLDGRRFTLTWDTEEGWHVVLTLASVDERFVYPVEARMLPKGSLREGLSFLIDMLDQYYDAYFKEEAYLPLDWAAYEDEGKEFFMRGQILNLYAERLGDALLGQGGVSS